MPKKPVYIKRVHKVKKKPSFKEKALAAFGLGSSLISGGGAAVKPHAPQTEIVSLKDKNQSKTSAAEKFAQTILGIKQAHASAPNWQGEAGQIYTDDEGNSYVWVLDDTEGHWEQQFQTTTQGPQIQPLVITSEYALTTKVGEAYSHQLQYTGGTGSVAWEISSGQLPAGLSLSNSGIIFGTAEQSTGQNGLDVVFKATDSQGNISSQQFTFYVDPADVANQPGVGVNINSGQNFNSNPLANTAGTNTASGSVLRLILNQTSFDLTAGQTAETKVYVDYSMPDGTYAQDSNVSVSAADSEIASAVYDQGSGSIGIEAKKAGQTIVTVHALQAGDDVSKDQRILVRVSDASASVISFNVSKNNQNLDNLSMVADSSSTFSALARLSNFSISPAIDISVVDNNQTSGQSNYVYTSVDQNGLVTVQAYNPFANMDQSQIDQNTAYNLQLVLHPRLAGTNKSFDKTINVIITPKGQYPGQNVDAPTMPEYIKSLAADVPMSSLSDSQKSELTNYFDANVGILPADFIPGSWFAYQIGFDNVIPNSNNGMGARSMAIGYSFGGNRYTSIFKIPSENSVGMNMSSGGSTAGLAVGAGLAGLGAYAAYTGALVTTTAVTYTPVMASIGTYATSMIGTTTTSSGTVAGSVSASLSSAGPLIVIGAAIMAGTLHWNHVHAQHLKADDVKITNDMMANIYAIVNTYNSNAAPTIEDEKLNHDMSSAGVAALFNTTAAYYKWPSSFDSQKGYVQGYIASMDSTLQQRLSAIQNSYNRLDIYQDASGNRSVLLDINDEMYKQITVSPSGQAQSETGRPVPQSIIDLLKNAPDSRVIKIASGGTNNTTPGQTATLVITAEYALTAKVGVEYNHQIQSTGGSGSNTWRLLSGPGWLNIDEQTGVLTGTPTEESQSDLVIQVTDSLGHTHSQQFTIYVDPADSNNSSLTLQQAILPEATVGQSYNYQFQITGGSGNYDWSVESGMPPTGLTINSNGFVLGVPNLPGTFVFSVKATDLSSGKTAVQQFTIRVNQQQQSGVGAAVVTGTHINVANAQGQQMKINGTDVGYTYTKVTGANGMVLFSITIDGGATYRDMTETELLAKIQAALSDPSKAIEAAALSHLYYSRDYNAPTEIVNNIQTTQSSSTYAANNLQNGSAVTNLAMQIQSQNPNMSWSQAVSLAQPQIQNQLNTTNYAGNYVQAVNARSTFVNINGSSAQFRSGDSWKLNITGAAANTDIYIDGTWVRPNGEVVQLHELIGSTSANGSAEFIREVQGVHAGNWSARVMVNGLQVGGDINFYVER